MPRPTIRVHDLETDQIVDREMTTAEYTDYKAMLELDVAEKEQADAKEAEKNALLTRLGITAEEAKLLLG